MRSEAHYIIPDLFSFSFKSGSCLFLKYNVPDPATLV